MSISSKLTIAMGEIDINYIYDISQSHISHLSPQCTGITTHHIQAKLILRSAAILERLQLIWRLSQDW